MIRKSMAAAGVLMILACTGGTEAESPDEPPACTDELFNNTLDGATPFDIASIRHRACNDTHALVAVKYKCTECEPVEQYFLSASDGGWAVEESGTGMDPSSCDAYEDDIDGDECATLWKAFHEDEKKRQKPKKKKKRRQ